MHKLKYLTIKPLIQCTLTCDYCSSRQLLFKSTYKKQLSVNDWARVFKQARDLGTTYLDISGGEPLIYKDLFALIWEAKRLGFYVSLNTTGFNFKKLQKELESVGLNKVCISLISLDEQENNIARGGGDDYRHAIDAIDALHSSNIDLALHFILSKTNYKQMPDIIDFAYQSNAASLSFAYPEDDHERRSLLLDSDEINDFLLNVLPRAEKKFKTNSLFDEKLPIFFDGHQVNAQYHEGVYWSDQEEAISSCDKPYNFLLIYPDGNVYPCNGIEYVHEPTLGNVLDDNLENIWTNNIMEDFRKKRIPFCRHCPIKRHVGFSINKNSIPPYSQEAVLNVPSTLTEERPLSVHKTFQSTSLSMPDTTQVEKPLTFHDFKNG